MPLRHLQFGMTQMTVIWRSSSVYYPAPPRYTSCMVQSSLFMVNQDFNPFSGNRPILKSSSQPWSWNKTYPWNYDWGELQKKPLPCHSVFYSSASYLVSICSLSVAHRRSHFSTYFSPSVQASLPILTARAK